MISAIKLSRVLFVFSLLFPTSALASVYCSEEGVRLEVLGSGELSLETTRSTESYLIWHNDRARVLVNPAPGSYLRYKYSGADFVDLLAIVVTQTGIEHTGDLVELLAASLRSERTEPLPIYGPDGDENHPSIEVLVERLLRSSGAYPQLASLLTYKSPTGYRLRTRNVAVPGRKPWSEFAMNQVHLAAIQVQSGSVPSLAWKVRVEDTTMVFAGELSNQRGRIRDFAKGANALVVTHRLPHGARGEALETHVTPNEIGRMAEAAGVENLLLGGRGWRTFGRETATQESIASHFEGPQIYANEGECWGL